MNWFKKSQIIGRLPSADSLISNDRIPVGEAILSIQRHFGSNVCQEILAATERMRGWTPRATEIYQALCVGSEEESQPEAAPEADQANFIPDLT